ncbi:hypothetical protein EBZ80_21915 [bacterium]|nr:hypothetical protein [bacterium]
MTASVEVELISAAWCGRCKTIKPEVAAACAVAGARFAVVDYDELDDCDPVKNSVTALPMIRMRRRSSRGADTPWEAYTPAQLPAWKEAMMAAAAAATATTGEDF